MWPVSLLVIPLASVPPPPGFSSATPGTALSQGSACYCFCHKQSSLLWLSLSLFSGFLLRCYSLREVYFNYAFIFQPSPENFSLFSPYHLPLPTHNLLYCQFSSTRGFKKESISALLSTALALKSRTFLGTSQVLNKYFM